MRFTFIRTENGVGGWARRRDATPGESEDGAADRGARHRPVGSHAGPRDARSPGMAAPARMQPRCGARTRIGTPCKTPAVWEHDEDGPWTKRGRCRMHGGLSTGPVRRMDELDRVRRSRASTRSLGDQHLNPSSASRESHFGCRTHAKRSRLLRRDAHAIRDTRQTRSMGPQRAKGAQSRQRGARTGSARGLPDLAADL